MCFPYLNDVVREAFGVDLPIQIPMLGSCIVCAFLIAVACFRFNSALALADPSQSDDHADELGGHLRLITRITLLSFVFGIFGAKLFAVIDVGNWKPGFNTDWLGRTGFNFYGGLVFGMSFGAWLVRQNKLPLPKLVDAVAPALMLGYALGRIGCQLSGDGDWGVASSLTARPNWLPSWLWAEHYYNNVLGMTLPSAGVYPTPLYEALVCSILFVVLECFIKHSFRHGWLFSLYLCLAGSERFLIELIRINDTRELFGIPITQAELLSLLAILAGSAGLIMTSRNRLSGSAASGAVEVP